MDRSDYIALGLYILGVVHSYWDNMDKLESYSFAADKPEFRNPNIGVKIGSFILSLFWPILAFIIIFTDTLGLHKSKYKYRQEMEEVERRRNINLGKVTDIDWV